MKKFFALLLAAMMILSCATAMAADPSDTIENTDKDTFKNDTADVVASDDADLDVYDSVEYTDGKDTFGEKGSMATELWLQVDATGQIDVTVPLVLVFQTNIDGGTATSPDTYKITNHSSADLVVTKIETTQVTTAAGKQPMTMVSYATTDLAEDTYAVQISDVSGVQGVQGAATYDLMTPAFAGDALKGGLFELEKAPANHNSASDSQGTVTNLDVTMRTGRLSFVTSRTATDGFDTTKGIQLLTIKYTVAIDTSDAIGEVIDGANGSPLSLPTDTNGKLVLQEVTDDGSGTVPETAGTGADSVAITPKTQSGAVKNDQDTVTP